MAKNEPEHWDSVYAKEKYASWREYPATAAMLTDIIPPNADVFDYGGGSGILAKKLVDKHRNVVVLDHSIEAVNQCREKGILAFRQDIREAIPKHRADYAIATEVLEHFPSSEAVHIIKNMRDSADNIIASVPNDCLHPDEHEEHEQTYDTLTLTNDLAITERPIKTWRFIDEMEQYERGLPGELDKKFEILTPVVMGLAGRRATELHAMRGSERVLIAAPVGGRRQYALGAWLEWISRQTHATYDVAVCVNGAGKDDLALQFAETSWTDVHGSQKAPLVLNLPGSDSERLTMLQRLTSARDALRAYAVEQDYDYLFFLDTDTIPPLDAIPRLISHDVAVVSGLYFYKRSSVPVACSGLTGKNYRLDVLKLAVEKDSLLKAGGFGYGCLLLRSDALNVAFNYERWGEKVSEDFGHGEELQEHGFALWLDPRVGCKHLEDPIRPAVPEGKDYVVSGYI